MNLKTLHNFFYSSPSNALSAVNVSKTGLSSYSNYDYLDFVVIVKYVSKN